MGTTNSEIQMSYKTITVSLKSEENAERLCAFACMVARKFNAHLIGIHTIPAIEIYPGLGMLADDSMMVDFSKNQRRVSKVIESIFDNAVRKETFVSEWREVNAKNIRLEYNLIADWVSSDLIIIGQSDPKVDRHDQQNLVEDAIRHSGRPVLVLPYAGTFKAIGENILLGWSGTKEASRAAHDALPFIKTAVNTQILLVGKQDDATHYVEQTATELAIGLDRHGAKVTVIHSELGSLTIGDELLNRACDLGADMIVTGGFGHSRIYDFVLGATTNHILRHMTVPVLLSH
jgi:nucleotide-binding universal stress UspA family protein